MYLLKDYLKLDGTPLANASNDYTDLLKFAQDNNLITADTSDKSLFKYDTNTDVLTLPDYIGLVVQGGNIVEEKEAGLPNITGTTGYTNYSGVGVTGAFYLKSTSAISSYSQAANTLYNTVFDASHSNSIYGNSTTVQPPAITLIPQIKYKKSTTMWETVEIGKFVATAPAHYEREQLYTTNKTTITIYPTWVNINGLGYVLEGTKIIDIENADNWDDPQYITAANRAGKDFYIYACEPVSDVASKFILSANSTVPNGYTANNSRKIGGFHCLCVDVGTISGHTLSGYLAGDILPASPWDLKHRAISENEGMVYVPEVGKWIDIYLASWDGSKLVSAYNGVPVTGTSAKAMHGIMMAEEFGKIGKFLPKYDEFIAAAKGTPEGSHISTDASPSGAGGHIDKSSRRIISNNGLEDCCGVLWQWGSDHCETTPNTTYTSGNYYVDGLYWIDNPVYNSTVDTVKRGSCIGLLRRLIFGGYHGNVVSYCGSRAVVCHNFGALLSVNIGGRGFSEMRK